MKLRTPSITLGLSALIFVFAPSIANADRDYLLVGSNHIYEVGDDPNLNQKDRMEIEQTYADCVASDLVTAETRIQNGGTPAQENQARNQDMLQLAQDRDDCLGELYENRDDLRDTFPEFKQIDCDGPYQLIEVEYHVDGQNDALERGHVPFLEAVGQTPQVTLDALTVQTPWPGYEPGEEPYGGWTYGKRYTTTEFFEHWHTWRVRHRGRISLIALSGHKGHIPFKNGRFTGTHASEWVVERGYAHGTGKLHKTGVIKRRRRKGG